MNDDNLINDLARKHKVTDRDAMGLLWDRDTVAFYGDPAWEARVVPQQELDWDQVLVRNGRRFRFQITARTAGKWGVPPMAFLPYRVKDVEIIRGAGMKPLIADDFVLLPLQGERKVGDVIILVFDASRL